MSLENYANDAKRCVRCSYCKWIVFAHVKSWRFAKGCPSVEFGKYHAYSAGGRFAVALSLVEGRTEYTDRLMDIVYKCQLCGSCDVACKVCRTLIEPLEMMTELRAKLVEDGQLLPEHMMVIDSLRKEDNMLMKPKTERGKWSEGLDVKNLTTDKAEVLFHAGCRLCYDDGVSPVAKKALNILKNAGVDVGIMGKEETCCGGRAFDMGFRGEFTKYGEHTTEMWETAGVKTVVTCCSDCYYTFNVLYPKYGLKKKDVEIVHFSEYLKRLIDAGKIKFKKSVPLKVTYHDPCHLGRLGEDFIPWEGVEKKVFGQVITHEPKKPIRRGANGVYALPREVLQSIPGVQLVEMERIKEYAWCCGSSGGVKEAYPDFAVWTAAERIEEAESTGAEALVTACPWCERNFLDAVQTHGKAMKIYDIVDLVQQAM
jgi:Fe-S oxidoreductase